MKRRAMKLSAGAARRIALAAQGFSQPRPRSVKDFRALRRVFGDVGLVQIDSVNVLVRSHFLPFFSRLGSYDRGLLERAAYRAPRELFEFWGHEASLMPVSLQPLMRWRMERAAEVAWRRMRAIAKENPKLVGSVLDEVRERGPLAASELSHERPKRAGSWWEWHDGKVAMEWLFWSGQVTCAERVGFERRYDLPERVLPKEIIGAKTPRLEDAQRELVRLSARALGVAAERDLRDYFRLSLKDSRRAVAELVDAGELLPVEVEGWRLPAFVHADAAEPRAIEAAALLSPFDSLVWERSRTHRLFDFHFRLEIYTPAHKRIHGYYVLPFLYGEQLVARVDLKADRQVGRLRVLGAYVEQKQHAPADEVADALHPELERMAAWLGLEAVSIERRGNLTSPLRRRRVAAGRSGA